MLAKLRDVSGYLLVVNTTNVLFVGQAVQIDQRTKQQAVLLGKSIVAFIGGTTQLVERSPEQVLEQMQGVEIYRQ